MQANRKSRWHLVTLEREKSQVYFEKKNHNLCLFFLKHTWNTRELHVFFWLISVFVVFRTSIRSQTKKVLPHWKNLTQFWNKTATIWWQKKAQRTQNKIEFQLRNKLIQKASVFCFVLWFFSLYFTHMRARKTN